MTRVVALRAYLSSRAGEFGEGYDSQLVDATLPQLSSLTGIRLCVLWNYVDRWGTGGDSRIIGHDGRRWMEVSDELVRHLHGDSPATDLLEKIRPGVDVRELFLDGELTADEAACVQEGAPVGLANIALDAYAGEAPSGS